MSSVDAATAPSADLSAVDDGGSLAVPAFAYDDAGNLVEVAPGDDGGDDASPIEGASTLTPVPGDIAITEIMLSPSGPEPQSEWFEVYNRTASPKLLSGLTIQDGYFDEQVIASSPAVVVAPYAYGLLVRDRAGASQALLPAPAILYAYGAGVAPDAGIELDAGDFGELSLWSGSTLLADVPYGEWAASFTGQSIELASPELSESDPNQWCVADTPWATGSDDGTPGAASDCEPVP
jgi:hypothetical protein